ncbi:MAG: GNAT family N-acetyltransferase [Myxococcales bacterium]|nr:MAG: GNAT family N-acetyltransferase [Myxococcales bacterium]
MTTPLLPKPSVLLRTASAADAPLLENLLQLYIHDLSAIFEQVELGEDGRYGYPALASYLSGAPERRAFLLRADGRLAGFALARLGSPALPDPRVWDVAEFFVLKRFRGQGVGRAAALGLWEEQRGAWTVRVANKNVSALAFWKRAVAEYRGGAVSELAWSPGAVPWTVFHLQPNE